MRILWILPMYCISRKIYCESSTIYFWSPSIHWNCSTMYFWSPPIHRRSSRIYCRTSSMYRKCSTMYRRTLSMYWKTSRMYRRSSTMYWRSSTICFIGIKINNNWNIHYFQHILRIYIFILSFLSWNPKKFITLWSVGWQNPVVMLWKSWSIGDGKIK